LNKSDIEDFFRIAFIAEKATILSEKEKSKYKISSILEIETKDGRGTFHIANVLGSDIKPDNRVERIREFVETYSQGGPFATIEGVNASRQVGEEILQFIDKLEKENDRPN